mmetsp:Transcript_1024/g.3038  ORF Transcript_1024/g.3038 Transcript_1024/m.3038 type:complete len:277 (-) Transcript_1024:330-1160(-)
MTRARPDRFSCTTTAGASRDRRPLAASFTSTERSRAMRSSPSRDTETANGGTAGRGMAPARRSRPVPHSEPLVCPKPRTSATRTHAARAPTTAGGRRARTRWHRRWQCSPRWWGGIVSTRTGSSAQASPTVAPTSSRSATTRARRASSPAYSRSSAVPTRALCAACPTGPSRSWPCGDTPTPPCRPATTGPGPKALSTRTRAAPIPPWTPLTRVTFTRRRATPPLLGPPRRAARRRQATTPAMASCATPARATASTRSRRTPFTVSNGRAARWVSR